MERTIIFINSREVRKQERKRMMLELLELGFFVSLMMLAFVGITKGLEYAIFHGGF